MKRVGPSILAVLAITLVLGAAASVRADKDGGNGGNGNGNNKGKKDPSGSYTATVAGYFKGEGTASATGNKITISANVTDENGKPGKFESKDLTVDSTNHFTGTGSAMGLTLTISGRVDAGGKDSAIKTKRFVCTFKTSKDSQGEEHHGRVVGFVDLSSPTVTPVNNGDPGTNPGPPGDGGDDGGPPPPSKGGKGNNGNGNGNGGNNNHHHPHRGGGHSDRD